MRVTRNIKIVLLLESMRKDISCDVGFFIRSYSMFSRRDVPSSLTLLMLSVLLIFSTAVLFAAPQMEENTSSDTMSVTDMRGRTITVPTHVDSVIGLEAGALRLISYLDATDSVIAVEDAGNGREKSDYNFFQLATYRIAHPELRDLPSIGNRENIEGIIAADPDLIITSIRDITQVDQLQDTLGIPVFAVDVDVELYDTDRFYHQLEVLGSVLGKEERAEQLIAGISSALEDIESRTAAINVPQKAYAGGMMYWGPADLLRTTGDYLPFDLSGTENVMPTNPAGNRQPYMTSLEDLVAAAPEYVFIDAANLNLSKAGFNTNRDVLMEQVPAFSNQEVYSTFVYKYYGTNWENQLINVYAVSKVLYPEAFADISIPEKAEELWKLFFASPLSYSTVTEKQGPGVAKVNWFN